MPIVVQLDLMLARRKMRSRDLAAAVDCMAEEVPLYWVGHSFGGAVAVNAAVGSVTQVEKRSAVNFRCCGCHVSPIPSTMGFIGVYG